MMTAYDMGHIMYTITNKIIIHFVNLSIFSCVANGREIINSLEKLKIVSAHKLNPDDPAEKYLFNCKLFKLKKGFHYHRSRIKARET